VLVEDQGEFVDAPDWTSSGPSDGVAQLWINSFPEGVEVGDHVRYRVDIIDDDKTEAITNEFVLEIHKEAKGGGDGGSKNKGGNTGTGTTGGTPQLALPPIIPVPRDEWEKNKFDEFTAIKVQLSDSKEGVDLYDFYVNVDNRFLKIAQKETKAEGLWIAGSTTSET